MKKIVDVVLEINEKFILPLESKERKNACSCRESNMQASVLSNTPTVPH